MKERNFDFASTTVGMAFQSELLLTEYLLNFEDESAEECSLETDGFSSGMELSDDEEDLLSTVKETLNSPKKSPKKKAAKKKAASKPTDNRSDPKRQSETEKKEKKRVSSKAYRKKKLDYLKSTEAECLQLRETNKVLNETNIELDEKVSSLEKQVEHLEKIIANETSLLAVLGAITKHSGLSFKNNPLGINSLKRKRVDGANDENEPEMKRLNGGVCVHVTPGGMSLEFCRECDLNAAGE